MYWAWIQQKQGLIQGPHTSLHIPPSNNNNDYKDKDNTDNEGQQGQRQHQQTHAEHIQQRQHTYRHKNIDNINDNNI